MLVAILREFHVQGFPKFFSDFLKTFEIFFIKILYLENGSIFFYEIQNKNVYLQVFKTGTPNSILIFFAKISYKKN